MIRKGSNNNPPPGIVMQEINPQQILRVVADTQVVIQIAVGILALRVLPILDLILAGGKVDRNLACRLHIERPAVFLTTARKCDLLRKL